jgi:hypothetical protein
LFDKHAFAFDLFTQGIGNVHVKAGGFAVSGFESEGFVGWVNGHFEVFALSKSAGAQGANGSSKQEFIHETTFSKMPAVASGLIEASDDSTILKSRLMGRFLPVCQRKSV